MLSIGVWDSYRDKASLEREFQSVAVSTLRTGVRSASWLSQSKVNKARRRRGFDAIDLACIKNKRRLGTVFVESEVDAESQTQADVMGEGS